MLFLLTEEEAAAFDAANEAAKPIDFDEAELYEDRCDHCGGRVVATGGNGYYNGSYQCYTLYLECENCGPYEVECV